jgi:hypothetical protein
MPPDRSAVLYTSLVKEGALAEISYRQRLLDPIPTKPILLHRLEVELRRVIQIAKSDLSRLGIDFGDHDSAGYVRSQEVGDVAYFLGCDGAIVPCARWSCDNLVIFEENLRGTAGFRLVESEEVDWKEWADKNAPRK